MMKNGIIRNIYIHCTATPNGRPVSLETVTGWHKAKGWETIGYHYLIDVDGHESTGRREEFMGAHVEGHNTGSIGVCIVGGVGGKDPWNPAMFTYAQWDRLRLRILELQHRYPESAIHGHRDVFGADRLKWQKVCPGFDVGRWLKGGMEPLPENLLEVGKSLG